MHPQKTFKQHTKSNLWVYFHLFMNCVLQQRRIWNFVIASQQQQAVCSKFTMAKLDNSSLYWCIRYCAVLLAEWASQRDLYVSGSS